MVFGVTREATKYNFVVKVCLMMFYYPFVKIFEDLLYFLIIYIYILCNIHLIRDPHFQLSFMGLTWIILHGFV